MPLVLTPSEFFAEFNADQLPIVKAKGPYLSYLIFTPSSLMTYRYASVEEYLTTYLRLLREDCFCEMRDGVKNILAGKPTAMNSFSNIRFSGIHFLKSGKGLCYCIDFKPTKNVKNWAENSQLQYPNIIPYFLLSLGLDMVIYCAYQRLGDSIIQSGQRFVFEVVTQLLIFY